MHQAQFDMQASLTSTGSSVIFCFYHQPKLDNNEVYFEQLQASENTM